ncbi:hypothetical protein B0A55_01886 [Friedmanniomyces simplex]|uniref:Uncharacterized protein n=1 Tax=Friedmanniomyces simplex TaxID=329884 RepID=A0A4U0XRV3_9PEZI|nr:hypothetical protein B0A55_01886 [Friedmanniomyces simplex]
MKLTFLLRSSLTLLLLPTLTYALPSSSNINANTNAKTNTNSTNPTPNPPPPNATNPKRQYIPTNPWCFACGAAGTSTALLQSAIDNFCAEQSGEMLDAAGPGQGGGVRIWEAASDDGVSLKILAIPLTGCGIQTVDYGECILNFWG